MDKPMSNLSFSIMSFIFKIRDSLSPPSNKLIEANLDPGMSVLDYGCGPGSYSVSAAEMVGESGKVYAVDITQAALKRVQLKAARKGLKNIDTICTDCETGLDGECIDVVLLYDTYHDLSTPGGVLEELHRVMKPGAILSFSDHHMKEEQIVSGLTHKELFKLTKKGRKTHSFTRIS
jgi:ubiquinone/menaquinone biosynthesis C-methylase UbiE